jgi:CRP/FNR family cyclic AMP-dependent transcriptional regulator
MTRLSDFFGDDEAVLRDVNAACHTARYEAGSIIFGEGDEDDWVGIVLEGRARALRYSADGTEVAVSTIGPGSLFGEMSAIRGSKRSADMYALDDLKIACLTGSAFVQLLAKYPPVALNLCQLLADRLENTTLRLFEEVTLTSKHKVFAWLLREAGQELGQGLPRIESMPTISELARHLNLARETVSRTVNSLKDQGIVGSRGQGLEILDRHRLVSLLEH